MKIKLFLPLLVPIFAVPVIYFIIQPPGITQEKLSGAGLSALLWIIGYILLRWAEKQNQRVLMGILLGGILFRMLIVILSMFFVRSFTQFDIMAYVVSLMLIYLACEFALVIDYTLRK